MGVIIDPATINPNIIFETPQVQGKVAANETKIANEETVKSELNQKLTASNSKENK